MHARRRFPVAVVLCLLALPLLVACDDDEAGLSGPPSCTGRVETPAPDAVLVAGERCAIRWTADLGAAVDISLLQDGEVVGVVADGTPNDGYHPWTATTYGRTDGAGFHLRVAAAGDDTCRVESGGLTVVDPGGCSLEFTSAWLSRVPVGTEWTLSWTGTGGSGTVDLDLVHVGAVVARLASDLPRDGSFTWTVDTYNEGTGTYWLALTDAAAPACSRASRYFAIVDEDACAITVSSPATGQVFAPGAAATVTYRAANASGPLRLALYADGTRLGVVAEGIDPLEPDYAWTVTDLGHGDPDALYALRLEDPGEANCWGSSGLFLIRD